MICLHTLTNKLAKRFITLNVKRLHYYLLFLNLSFQNDTLIVRAIKNVPPGGEIFNCYGELTSILCLF